MRSLLALCAALLLWTPAQAQHPSVSLHSGPMPELVLMCETLEDLRSIVTAAQRRGPSASTDEYKRINAAAWQQDGKRACKLDWLSPLLQLKAIEAYPLVESIYNELYDVVLLKAQGWDGPPRYAAIKRLFAKGNAI